MKKNQNGFSAIETLLIFVIVCVVGFAGWYIYRARDIANDSLDNAGNNQLADNSSDQEDEADNPTANWATFSDSKGKYSFKYPADWIIAPNVDMCSEGLVLIGANAASVGACATENFGQMGFHSTNGNTTEEVSLNTEGYNNHTSESVTIDGVSGTKETATAKDQQLGDGPGGLKDGTEVIKYVFFTNGRTYTATYVQAEQYPDSLSDFELLMTKTFKFSG